MPRLFPSLGRSSKEQAHAYGGYEQGYDAPRSYYPNYGYEEQEAQHSSAWRKVFPKKSKKNYLSRQIEDAAHPRRGGYRTTVEDYPEDHQHVPTDDTQSFEELLMAPHRGDNTVPLVQRESSLTRLQQAFADHGTYAPALSAVPSGSHGAPFYAPHPMPAGQPHVTAVNNMHDPPVVVQNTVPGRNGSIRPDIDIAPHSSSYPSRREQPLHRRERSAPPREKSSRDHPAYWDKPLDPEEEPPVVVVVEHGKNGKKDKYYIIPGGAPVIFEDESGNELTRVGDFSGRYRPPRRLRPVIVQDQYGREICRAGFNHDDQISVGSRSLDGQSYHSESGRSHYRGRPSQRAQAPRESRERGSYNEYSHSSSRMYAPDSYIRDPHYQPSRRAGTRPSHDDLRYVDPSDPRPPRSERSAGHSSNDTLVHSTSPRRGDHHGQSRGHDRRDHGSDRDYSHRRDYRTNGSRGSGSSGDSYDRSYRRHDDRYD